MSSRRRTAHKNETTAKTAPMTAATAETIPKEGGENVELLDLNATVHLDLSEIDKAIEKVNRLLSLLQEVKKASGSNEIN